VSIACCRCQNMKAFGWTRTPPGCVYPPILACLVPFCFVRVRRAEPQALLGPWHQPKFYRKTCLDVLATCGSRRTCVFLALISVGWRHISCAPIPSELAHPINALRRHRWLLSPKVQGGVEPGEEAQHGGDKHVLHLVHPVED